jgi:hypothetical protein
LSKKPISEMSDFEIEEALFAQIRSQQLKVAMIVALALAWDVDDTDVARIDLAFETLVADKRVVSFGNIANWRHSEVALA